MLCKLLSFTTAIYYDCAMAVAISISGPLVAQQQAADPAAHVWVNASAGSGKTKVLIDRLLRLLLGTEEMRPVEPGRILCLTFTRAAAAEMQHRLQHRLMQWAVLDETKLQAALEDLTGQVPNARQLHRAQGLWQKMLAASPPLRIQTIHSLAQSILAQFPLEAGVMPYFTLLPEWQLDGLRQQAMQQLWQDPSLATTWQRVSAQNNSKDYLQKTLWRAAQTTILPSHDTFCRAFGLPAAIDLNAPLAIELSFTQQHQLKRLLQGLQGSTQAEQKLKQQIVQWLEASAPQRQPILQHYADCWLTQTGEPRKKLLSVATLKQHPELNELAGQATNDVMHWLQLNDAQQAALLTADWLQLGQAAAKIYRQLKRAEHGLDYDDLIHHAAALLQDPAQAMWVLYKLDGGLDHLLVDEAQDTSPTQWAIIKALSNDFWGGLSARNHHRTLFVVGDFKQSIYSFQGADPRQTAHIRDQLAEYAQNAQKEWRQVPLQHSFRSTVEILKFIDAVFADAALARAVTLEETIVTHIAQPDAKGGEVTVWPVFTLAEKTSEAPWALTDYQTSEHPVEQLAQQVAQTIADWLKKGKTLFATGCAITPGDIMIIARKRNPLLNACRRALQQQHIPVAADDQIAIFETLAVQDCLSFLRWCTDADDDLALAEILKGPLFNWQDDQLFDLAYGRDDTLWQALQAKAENISAYLAHWLKQAALLPLAKFLVDWLHSACLTAANGWLAFAAIHGPLSQSYIQQFLQLADSFAAAGPAHLPGFLNWCREQADLTLKQASSMPLAVRLLTVHGAKGAEAPIIFVLDDLQAAGKGWRQENDWLPADPAFSFPRYIGNIDFPTPVLNEAIEKQRAAYMAEHWRLLYVALSRARERLIIAAYGSEKTDLAESWFGAVQAGLQRL